MSDFLRVLALLALIAGNAFFVIGEYAVVTARRGPLRRRAEAGSAGLGADRAAADGRPGTGHLDGAGGITAIGILTGAVGEPLVRDLLGAAIPGWLGFLIAFAVITYLSVLLGELVPKALTLDRAAPIPGVSPSPPLLLPPRLKPRLWHLMFNQLPAEVNEALVKGREDVFFGAEFDASAGTNKLPDDVIRYYIDTLAADPEALRGSFEIYRAFPEIIAQNEQRNSRRLTLPVLAIGGAESSGEGPANTMKLVADDVQGVVLPDRGHWVAEQAPEALLTVLTAFLAPYRDGTGARRNSAEVRTA
jgi:pimeloyl-ACP methyl ester carboxylesterase